MKQVGKALRIISSDEEKGIGVVIDAPTLLPDFHLDILEKLRATLEKLGTIRLGKIITDRQVTKDESNIIRNQGFHEEIVSSDVDIHVTIRSLELTQEKGLDILAIGTTDQALYPVFAQLKMVKKLALISWQKDVTPAMESIVDYIIYLDYLDGEGKS
ncbi:hypothetical protein EU523_00665 [Candidatus Heimdallarchaeota archaeon]|nr:MAG: hypothetical protein EU523_00665 [Candidatus Heimdallarchaeota archaeon]